MRDSSSVMMNPLSPEAHIYVHSKILVSESQREWARLQDKHRTFSFTGTHRANSKETCMEARVQEWICGFIASFFILWWEINDRSYSSPSFWSCNNLNTSLSKKYDSREWSHSLIASLINFIMYNTFNWIWVRKA